MIKARDLARGQEMKNGVAGKMGNGGAWWARTARLSLESSAGSRV